jgi:hypothetical protein
MRASPEPGQSARAAVVLGILCKQSNDLPGAIAAFRHARSVGPPDVARQSTQQLSLLGEA